MDLRIRRPDSVDDLIGAIVDPLASAYGEFDTPEARRAFHATSGQRLVLAYYFYWDGVTNGGHAQYLANYPPDQWDDALHACTKFGIPEADLIRGAINLFPDKMAGRSQEECCEQLERIDEDKLNDLDHCFYELPESADHVRRYIDSHPNEFFLDE